jgi:hypothetical protein
MKVKELKQKQLFSVPCPTCGAAVGQPSELIAGGKRNDPHPDRKLVAAEAVENNRIQMDA